MELTTQIVDLFQKTLNKAAKSSLLLRPPVFLFKEEVKYSQEGGYIHTIRTLDKDRDRAVGTIEVVAYFDKKKVKGAKRVRRFILTNLIDITRYKNEFKRGRTFFSPNGSNLPLVLDTNSLESKAIVRRQFTFISKVVDKAGKVLTSKTFSIEITPEEQMRLAELIYDSVRLYPVERKFMANFLRDLFFYPYKNAPSEIKSKYLVWEHPQAKELL